ncbi:hypothetical protein J7E88_06015 [Streptomyces sp. ISL-10]|uniref:hypothetical protein n=1 Tax=Streptomyces sp. ISL-10 TaxID=2819172 RepID=UPI001BE7B3E7|nr:hypothetical protein [Streptomyces sp. ISL-10]MBT2364888.1 hypothetical protein [Streptomyces sp. ISL-10]
MGAAWALTAGSSGRGGAGAAWALTGGSSGGGAGDARGACDALAGFDESKCTADGDEGLVALNHLSAAMPLSAAADRGDSAYQPLADSCAGRRAALRGSSRSTPA